MTVSGILECSTCGNKIRVRYQVGIINPVNVRIGCQGCGKVIKGFIDRSKDLFEFYSDKWDNNYIETSQTASISTELPISSEANKTGFAILTPFMAIGSILGGFEKVEYFSQNLNSLQLIHDSKFEKLELLTDLLESNSIEYFLKESKIGFRPNLSLDLDQFDEYSNVIIQITNDFFKYIETDFYRMNFKESIINSLINSNISKKAELNKFKLQLNEYTFLEDEFKKGQVLLIRFLKHVKSFLPVICLSYNDDFARQYEAELTITTFDYSELKDMYVEQFEFLTRISSLHFGLWNLAERNDFNDFGTIRDCRVLEDYQKKDNGVKKEIIKKSPILNNYFLNTLNSQVRNGIGHLKTKYNPINQELVYFPYKVKAKINNSKTIHLIDFTYLIYQQTLKIRDTLILIQKIYEKTK